MRSAAPSRNSVSGEETISQGQKYFKLSCRYLTHDGKLFGEVATSLRISEFRECFQDIMFLTTNRVTTFDEAFQSRIHFTMKYDDLSPKAREKIWETFLRRVDSKLKIVISK